MKMDLHDLIQLVACDLYVRSGNAEGRDMENWLQAEWIVKHCFKNVGRGLDHIF